MPSQPSVQAAGEPLAGCTVLVTGGAHRVGGAISRHLASRGARVVVSYHSSAADAEDLVAELGRGSLALPADLSRARAAGELLDACGDAGALPTAVVHSAASFLHRPAVETTAEEWDSVLALNTRAFFLLARELARHHGVGADGRTGGGAEGEPPDLSLVAISDAGALELWPGYAVHCVSKAALLPLVRVLAKSLAPSMRVNAVLPGPVLPEAESGAEQVEAMRRRTLLKRLGDPTDVARSVAFLLENRFVTGASLEVTGGSHLWRGSAERE